ncbi:multiheme c-type cytochrome [Tunturibacter empetritectus]|uniref:multiheme c-type cytochrome n=1 Tax=Tunturiibacter empetritectus TaxID=3069691 RepID=UPI00161DE300|nr:multiheme c-type cytochrome [Edaphobacter lichenicola]
MSYIHTSHSLTSRPVNKDSVLGSFTEGRNILTIVDSANAAGQPGLYFKMEEKEDGYYQTAVTGFDSQLLTHTERMDLVTGSGVRGATYLYWEGDQLFELPVSYWTDGHRWINSPGYTNGTADFSRPINPGCLECHASYIQPLSTDPTTNHYDRTSLVTGIACERCHGSGAEHIARRRDGTAGQAILNPARFSRDRQVDLCALCHNGIRREATAPAFSYVPGQPLSNYFKHLPVSTAEHPDVHGNQVGLLERSRCYLSSPQMSCSTCHDVHALERPAAAYSERCLNCHKWQSCGVSKKLGHAITNKCIDCHMPVEQTNVIVSETGDRIVQASMRNHWIKVYPLPRSKPAVKH